MLVAMLWRPAQQPKRVAQVANAMAQSFLEHSSKLLEWQLAHATSRLQSQSPLCLMEKTSSLGLYL